MLKKIFIISILSFFLFSCKKSPKIIGDYVKLDKAYISVMLTAQSGDKEKIGKVMTVLLSKWAQFFKKNRTYSKRIDWESDLKRTGEHLKRANLLFCGKKEKEALASLKQGRTLLYHMRKNINVKYYLDTLRDFSVPMEWMVGYINRQDFMKPGNLSLLRQSFATARPRWKELSKHLDLLKEQFQFNDSKMDKMKQLLKAGEVNLSNLAKTLIARNADEIKGAVLKAEGHYLKILNIFKES